MITERDVYRRTIKCLSPDRRVWFLIHDSFFRDHPEVHDEVEKQLIRARSHGVNGQIVITVTRHEDESTTYDYEPAGSIPVHL